MPRKCRRVGRPKGRELGELKHIRNSWLCHQMTNETFEQYLAICDALGEHRARQVLAIIIDAQYNDLMKEKVENKLMNGLIGSRKLKNQSKKCD